MPGFLPCVVFFFFNDTATTEIYTLSLHDALPILAHRVVVGVELLDFDGLDGGVERVGALHDELEGLLHPAQAVKIRSEEHTSELQSHSDLVCRLLLVRKNLMLSRHVPPVQTH